MTVFPEATVLYSSTSAWMVSSQINMLAEGSVSIEVSIVKVEFRIDQHRTGVGRDETAGLERDFHQNRIWHPFRVTVLLEEPGIFRDIVFADDTHWFFKFMPVPFEFENP